MELLVSASFSGPVLWNAALSFALVSGGYLDGLASSNPDSCRNDSIFSSLVTR